MKALVFDIGGTSIKYAVCENGVLTDSRETPTNAKLGGAHVLETIVSLIEKENGYEAIGISTAGQVNSETGSIIYANSNLPNYTGMQLRAELENRFFVPVMVENDVNCAALGEAIYGAGSDYDSFLCLTYGTGVGGAIIQNNSVYHGSSFSAGEFGAIVTHAEEKLHGSDVFDGCYERYASTTALVRSASAFNPMLENGRAIFENLEMDGVKELLDKWIDEILLGLSTLIHIFNPPCIVLGGGIMVQPYIMERLQAKLSDFIMPSFAHVSVVPAALGNTAGMLGVYYLTEQYVASKK